MVENFGCRASAADGDAVAAGMERLGLAAAAGWREAAVVVVNTCAVTVNAEASARALIRRVRRDNPEARILVTGCYAQRAPEEISALPGVSAVVGNSHKDHAARVAASLSAPAALQSRAFHAACSAEIPGAGIESAEPGSGTGLSFSSSPTGPGFSAPASQPGAQGFVPLARLQGLDGASILHASFSAFLHQSWDTSCWSESAQDSLLPATVAARRTRPILKVQDGCGNRCSFCVIPETRGPSRSVPLREAVRAAREFADGGGKELVLSGINLGRWGRDLAPAQDFPSLVRALLEETNLPRLRISSVEPMDWTPELLSLFARYAGGEHPRLAPHAHLPLQSGADAVLRRMHRRYRPWHYAEKLRQLRDTMPEAALGADVMVGFPGETEALFEESYRFLEAQPLTYFHLFPFSPRPRTPADRLPGRVAPAEMRRRMQRLEALHTEKQRRFTQGFAGRRLSAVTLRDGTALTANFLSISLLSPVAENRLLSLRLASMQEEQQNGLLCLHGTPA